VIALTLRTWLRYVVPLTLVAIIACAPLLYVALTAQPPADFARGRSQLRLGWGLAGCAIGFQLLLVAGVAPAVRAVAGGVPLSQGAALLAGLRGLVRGVLPWAVAIASVLLGGLALVGPGLLLVCLVSLTGASDQLGTSPQAAIMDSVNVVRRQLPRIALLVLAIVAIDLAITFAVQSMYVPVIAKKASAAKLLPVRTFLRITVLAIVAVSALPACGLAAAYSDAKRR
jgi:hypothetical protein